MMWAFTTKLLAVAKNAVVPVASAHVFVDHTGVPILDTAPLLNCQEIVCHKAGDLEHTTINKKEGVYEGAS